MCHGFGDYDGLFYLTVLGLISYVVLLCEDMARTICISFSNRMW